MFHKEGPWGCAPKGTYSHCSSPPNSPALSDTQRSLLLVWALCGIGSFFRNGKANVFFFRTVTFIIHENSVTVCLHNCKQYMPVLLTSHQTQPCQQPPAGRPVLFGQAGGLAQPTGPAGLSGQGRPSQLGRPAARFSWGGGIFYLSFGLPYCPGTVLSSPQ